MSKQPDLARYTTQTRSLSTNLARVPWRSTASQQGKKKTPVEKATEAAKRNDRKKAIADAVDLAQSRVKEQAEFLHNKLGDHSAKYYHRELAQLARIADSEREANPWNAFLKDELNKANTALPEGTPRYKSNNLPPGTKEKWDAMSPQERTEYTKPLVEKLNETREMRKLSTHNIPLNAFHDVRGNLASIERQLQALNARTGTEVVLIAVRSSLDHYNRPYIFNTSDRLADYFNIVLGKQLPDIGVQMEAFCLSGIQGVLNKSRDYMAATRSEINTIIYAKLHAAAQHKVPRMYYTNFESKITLKYGVIVKGWPLEQFCSPSDVRSRDELNVLLRAWQTGTAQFYKMDPVEYKAWRESRTEVAEAEEGENEGNGSADKADSTSNMAGAIPITVQAADASTIILAPAISMPQAAASPFVVASATIAPLTPINTTMVMQAHPIAESDFNVVLAQKRSATTAAPHAKKPRTQRGSTEFVNIVSGAGGELVTVTKKPRATRKDKGVPRKKKTHRSAGDENHAPTLSADAAITATDSPPSFCAASQTAGPMTTFAPPLDV